jgi:hypothetical protein
MYQQTRKRLVSIMLCLAIAVTTCGVNAQSDSDTHDKSNFLDSLLNEKLEFYRHLYPEISFLILKGGDELVADMMALDLALGHQPSSLDYEHPPKLREDLMIASANRIVYMLQYSMPSASLFKADDPLGWQEHICVLTINPDEIAADSVQATRNLLDLPQEFIQNIPDDLRLQPTDYLEFVIDHEVYHCLQSMYVGPQEMSHKEFWGEYNHFLNEQGADAYAMGMHINTRLENSSFAKNILRIRGMALYSGDPDHLTCKALQQIFKVPVEDMAEMSAKEVFGTANRIREHVTISYDEYIQYLASSVQAMKVLGVEDLVSDELRNRIKDVQSDPAQVKELVTNTRRYLSELSCDEI